MILPKDNAASSTLSKATTSETDSIIMPAAASDSSKIKVQDVNKREGLRRNVHDNNIDDITSIYSNGSPRILPPAIYKNRSFHHLSDTVRCKGIKTYIGKKIKKNYYANKGDKHKLLHLSKKNLPRIPTGACRGGLLVTQKNNNRGSALPTITTPAITNTEHSVIPSSLYYNLGNIICSLLHFMTASFTLFLH